MKTLRLMTATALIAYLLVGGMACVGPTSSDASRYPVDTTTIAIGQQLESAPGWYRDAVVYHIWVKAFADGAYQDGIGDLPGLQGKLDYLQSLGVNTLWLSPIFECGYKGDNMHGYDTTDYYAVNDRFGTRADLKALIEAVHAKGMRILFDFVPNHTSTKHPWFTNAATRDSWYVWNSGQPAGWGLPWGGGTPQDVWKSGASGYFYTSFATDTLADLNFYNPAVQAEMRKVQAFWLDRGFDGMRVDAVRYLCETGPGQQADQPDTHTRLQAFRALLDEYDSGDLHPHPGNDPLKHSSKAMIAEAWTNDASGVTPYYGNGTNEFHMCLDFSAPWAVYNTINRGDATQLTSLWEYEQRTYPAGYRSATFDSNHDNLISRPGTQYGGDRGRIILAEALNLLSPGTPILYYGNEVGMTGKAGADINLRQPMDWAAVATQTGQPDSILSWCKYLIQARNTYPALRGGYATLATDVGTGKALAYLRDAGTERVLVVANLTGSPQTVTVSGLTALGAPSGGPVQAILGDLKGATALSGDTYTAASLPPFGIRVLYVAGTGFQGTLHGDLN
ncbi:alpha-amylase family glycosyl hydrolase [Geothrix alkalitolerans]|uniref:alpha-amylase family glycosyl hydrolase n=1 Tax=Geothrix alkalitolerans TaxID=2922724 RepID=UPI001FAEC58A